MYINTKVENVPVRLEVKSVGPASLVDIDEFRKKLTAGSLVLTDQKMLDNVQYDPRSLVQSVQQSPDEKPDVEDVIEDVKEIFENNKDPEVTQGKKPWYKSKTIISNVLASLVCITGLFISDDIESSMYLPASIVSLLNLYLRTVTNSSVQIPMEEKIKRLSKTFLSK